MILFLMCPRTPGSTRTGPLCPYTTLFRSQGLHRLAVERVGQHLRAHVRRLGQLVCGRARRHGGDDGGRPRKIPGQLARDLRPVAARSEEHTSELQSLMRISYAVFCLKKKNTNMHTVDWTKAHKMIRE